MKRSLRRPALAVGIGALVVAAGLLLLELLVRVGGVEPPSPSQGAGALPGLRSDVVGPSLAPGWSGGWPADLDGGTEEFRVSADERGFRSHGRASPRQPEARVAFLGDSCTFGWGVEGEETFAARLEEIARAKGLGLEALNAGFPGHSAVLGPPVLRERVLPHAPDLVVAGYSANNAFRFSLVSDDERLGAYRLRRLLFRSRVAEIASALLARSMRQPEMASPRREARREGIPIERLVRVASPGEYEAALRELVETARSARARPLFLLLPRLSQIARPPHREDVAYLLALAAEDASVAERLRPLLEFSCLDHRRPDAREVLEGEAARWRMMRPTEPAVMERLVEGARELREGRLELASYQFGQALRLDPEAPLAHYDLGVAEIARGRAAAGLASLERAVELSCSVFFQYQIRMWRVALALEVPVVDILIAFQAEGGGRLFLDVAHPSAAGHEVIARALWPVLAAELARGDEG